MVLTTSTSERLHAVDVHFDYFARIPVACVFVRPFMDMGMLARDTFRC